MAGWLDGQTLDSKFIGLLWDVGSTPESRTAPAGDASYVYFLVKYI